jgi:hypothetical protein
VPETDAAELQSAPPQHAGALAAAAWLAERGLISEQSRWSIEIELPAIEGDARLQLDIYAEEWGFQFAHRDARSWIRVTDVAFVHGHDDHALLPRTPELRDIGAFIATLEREHGVRFDRHAPVIRTRVPNAEPAVRAWVASL